MDKSVEVRCPQCHQKLCDAMPGSEIEIKCPRKKCGITFEIKIKSDESVEHTVIRE